MMFRVTFLLVLALNLAAFGQPKANTPVPATPAAPTNSSSEEIVANGELTKMVADFFASLEKGEIDEAYANLTKGSRIAEKPEDLRVLKTKTKEAVEVFGAIQGYELVDTKRVGTKLIRQTYLSLGVEYPLRWRFYFYLANNRWRLIDLRVDDRLAGMFDEPKESAEETRSGQQ